MERPINLKPLAVRDENPAINRRKAAVDGNLKSSKPLTKRLGKSLDSRKALNDITNKSSVLQEALSQKKNLQSKKGNNVGVEDGNLRPNSAEAEKTSNKESRKSERVHIAEEGFLHDHSKCVDAQKAASKLDFWGTVLPGHDSDDLTMKQAKNDRDNAMGSSSVVLEEISMPDELSDWFSSRWKSPPLSPIHHTDSLPSSIVDWELETFELKLKE